MIQKIEKIKGLGIFHDYKASATLSDFKRYNLIYGWNGCGKTTLSRLFAMLEAGSSSEYPAVEYRIVGENVKVIQKEVYPRKVRVFNQDFVRENSPSLEDASTTTKHIFILGKDDKDLAAEVELEIKEKTTLEELLNTDDKKAGKTSLSTAAEQLVKARNTLFTDIAKTIASSRGRAFRDYDRRDAIKVYNALSQKEELDAGNLEKCHSVIEQKSQAKLASVRPPEGTATLLNSVIENANRLLGETIKQKAISRLTENPDIADWVAKGVELHREHKSSKCEYCDQAIPQERLDELAMHFNAAHKELMNSINQQLDLLRKVYSAVGELKCVDKTNLYEHLRDDYETRKLAVEKAQRDILEQITKLGDVLNEKKVKSHEVISPLAVFTLDELTSVLDSLNTLIDEHNRMTDDFEETIHKAKDQLEKHYVSTIYDAIKSIEKDIDENSQAIQTTRLRITALDASITTKQSTIRDSKIACDKLNMMLEQFLGRNEIRFEDSEHGYLIKRNGELANHLSEGEKTAISFVYFLIGLESDGFDIKEGIIVIDDPISSLDMDAVFRVCALIKTKLTKCHQLVLLTHNYEFFNQVKSWFNNDPSVAARDKDPTKVHGSFFMIKNPIDKTASRRIAKLDELDPLLRDYESEYHYLFKKLSEYKTEVVKVGQDTIEAVYPYPNIARKTLECFLSFRVPTTGSLYVRLGKLRNFDKAAISREEIEDVYNFVNSHSHLDTKTGLIQFDPTLAKNGEKYIEMTLELIRKSDPKHFADMTKLI